MARSRGLGDVYKRQAFKPLAPLDAEAKMPAAYLAAANLIGT
jgi:hypothetical protein